MSGNEMPRLAPMLIGSEWRRTFDGPTTPVVNPATEEVLAEVPAGGEREVAEAVAAAQAAFPEWSAVPAPRRAHYLFRYRALLEEHFEELARLITLEHGKALDESRGSLRRGLEVVEFACGIPTLLMGETLTDISRGIDGSLIRQPLGVCAGITPFNFPGMIPLWMFPVAIACGNTFVLKPSLRTPLTSVRLVELAREAGLPDGVINLVHGGREAVDALLTHPDVKAVSFVGSTPVAQHIYATAAAHGKRVQALGGAKNYLTVMPDADMERTVKAVIDSAFGSTGQRCLAASVLIAVGAAGDEIVSRLVEAARQVRVGDGLDPETFMGPLVSREALERVTHYIELGVRDGAELLLDGREHPRYGSGRGFFIGPTIFDRVPPESALVRDEIFGPVLAVIRADTLEEAIALAGRSAYGNASAIFTRDGKAARTYALAVDAGMVGVNIGVPAPMAFFSFGGHRASFFGDLRAHGKDGVHFYTAEKSITTRWF
ncbi:MAG: CoA-acylating methylmalonate-semialdehyde dehydrogenase [Symbiobacterium sp.]|uniref:CoA-acylating methylmalonate-semialdehyde dehydrogenase n=1 Tax=Symbiobacterium sp. TaxID=1971213 RepID=UPI0034645985